MSVLTYYNIAKDNRELQLTGILKRRNKDYNIAKDNRELQPDFAAYPLRRNYNIAKDNRELQRISSSASSCRIIT